MFALFTILLSALAPSLADTSFRQNTFSSATNSSGTSSGLLTVRLRPGNWRTLSRWKKGASMASKVVTNAQ